MGVLFVNRGTGKGDKANQLLAQTGSVVAQIILSGLAFLRLVRRDVVHRVRLGDHRHPAVADREAAANGRGRG